MVSSSACAVLLMELHWQTFSRRMSMPWICVRSLVVMTTTGS